MAQAPRERKQAAHNLFNLTPIPERPKSASKDKRKHRSQLGTIDHPGPQDRLCAQAVHAEQVDKVRRRQVKVDVFEAEQDGKEEGPAEHGRLVSYGDHGQYQYAIEEAIVLEVNMINDEKCWRQDDGDGCRMSGLLEIDGRS